MTKALLSKFALMGLLGLLFAFALVNFDASSAALRAHESASAIVMADELLEPRERAHALAEARAILLTAPTRPLGWRADANETQSWIASLLIEHGQSSMDEARDYAERAVRLDPTQAVSLQRLAAFGLRGAANDVCAPAACLERAFVASPMLPEPIACDRLRLSHLAGLSFSADDPRLANYLALNPSAARVRQCLSFLPAQTLYGALLRARAAEMR